MTEERIIELLCKKYSNKTLTSQYKYELDTIENVSKTISELIYKNITSELSSNVERRKNLIMFLRSYLDVNHDHMELNYYNYSAAVDAINDNIKHNNMQDLIIAAENADITSGNSMLMSDICNHYDKIDDKLKNISSFKDYIAERDQEKLQHFNAHKSIIYERESMPIFLANLLSLDIDDVNVRLEQSSGDTTQTKKLRRNYRILQVDCIYALLNLMEGDKDKMLLQKLLQNMSIYKELIKPELNLLNYILTIGNEDARLMMLKYFQFMLEKSVIRLCAQILETDLNSWHNLDEINILDDIVRLAQEDVDLRHQISDMLFELYKLSNCNKKLMDLFRTFEQKIALLGCNK